MDPKRISGIGASARRHRGRTRLSMLLCAITWASAGCVTTTVSLDAPPEISPAVAKRDLGVDYLTTGRTALAIREFRAALALAPRDAETHLWLGEAYRRKGQTDVAEESLEEAIALAERNDDLRVAHEARLNLSALLGQLGRYEEAVEQSDILVGDPTLSSPWRPLTNAGWALMKLGRLSEARSRFEQALDYFPNYGRALLNLGILEAREGNRVAAVTILERALERMNTSGTAEVHYRLGELYVALGRRDRAVEHFSAAVKTAPNLDWGSQSQAYLDLLR